MSDDNVNPLRLPSNFIEPDYLLSLDEAQIEQLVGQIRERRLLAVMAYEQVRQERTRVKQEKHAKTYDKIAKKMGATIGKIDGELEKLVSLQAQLRVARLEAFDIL